MAVIITSWAFDAWSKLKAEGQFTDEHHNEILRPSALLLHHYPDHPRFQQSKFWGPAFGLDKKKIPGGFKMKWHNFGTGNIQLRLCVGIHEGDAYLCHAYVKSSAQVDKRQMAKLKHRMELIRARKHTEMGRLT